MKRLFAVIGIFALLCGCGSGDDCLERGLRFREKLINSGCSFVAEITADYGDQIYTFSVGCTADTNGGISFIVISPESISGIAGKLEADSGFLTFGDEVLAFPLLADGEVSPVSAPWLLIKTLRSGYLSSAGMDGEHLQLTLNDSYEEDALLLDVWLNEENVPIHGDIMWQGRRMLSISVKDFAFV